MTRFLRPIRAALLAVGIVAAGPGAAPAVAALPIIEAESMTGSGAVRSDSNASGGRAVRFTRNGSRSSSVTLSAAASGVTITAKGDQCRGAPAATLEVDGVAVQSVAVANTDWAGHTIATAIAAGQHTVAVTYANDVSTRSCDRNLYVDRLSFNGEPGPTADGFSVRRLWLNSDSGSAFDFAADSHKHDVFIAHAADSWAHADSFHASHPDGAAYFYVDFGVAGDPCCVASVLDTATVEANGWWATRNGARIPNPWGGPSWLVDLGKPGVAAAYVSALKAKWGTNNWQGVFADDVNAWRNLGYNIDGYASPTDWINRAVVPLVKTVTDAITAAKGGVVVPNIGNWPLEPDMDAVADVASGGFTEWFLTWTNGQRQTVAEIENEYHSMRRAIGNGKTYHGVVHSTSLTRYAFCAAAIMGERDHVFITNQTAYGSAPVTWDPVFELDLGSPTEPPQHTTGSTAWSRRFTNHFLSIDTANQTCTIQ